ncbi:hypothetical protein [Bacillus sp. AFS017336]|uniref:hypothetical protein n=1 Tax=Bacillus sp. AFS017336 TaxID=2033489 RepID=UPI000BF0AAA6|nr:hypothetical protein [Bacillus sp. AFS017336]PEK98841.1 hypothetical protein CN601_24750 [Bacillus sp. AFS017336]
MKIVKAKKALLGTTLAGAVAVAASYGTYSWFTSETTAKGKITNTIVQLNNGEDIKGSIVEAENFAPSQLVFGDWLTIDNTGTADTFLQAKLQQSLDKPLPLNKYKVGYVALKYKVKPTEEVLKESQTKLEELFEGTTNEVHPSLAPAELPKGVEMVTGFLNAPTAAGFVATGAAANSAAAGNKTLLLGDGAEPGEDNEFWNLETDEYIDISFGVKLDESAKNDYQGVAYSANLSVKAKQKDDGALYK